MIDPIEIIGKARRRIAELAALRVAIYAVPPILTTLALGLAFEAIGPATWERWGYVLAPSQGWVVRVGLLAATALLGVAFQGRERFQAPRQDGPLVQRITARAVTLVFTDK